MKVKPRKPEEIEDITIFRQKLSLVDEEGWVVVIRYKDGYSAAFSCGRELPWAFECIMRQLRGGVPGRMSKGNTILGKFFKEEQSNLSKMLLG